MSEVLPRPADQMIINSAIGSMILMRLAAEDADRVYDLVYFDTLHFTEVNEGVPDKISTPDKLIDWVLSASSDDIKERNTKFGMWIGGEMVGCIGYRDYGFKPKMAEIWYWVGKEHIGNKYAETAASILRGQLFDKGYSSVEARVLPKNRGSTRTLENAGFSVSGWSDKFLVYASQNESMIKESASKRHRRKARNF